MRAGIPREVRVGRLGRELKPFVGFGLFHLFGCWVHLSLLHGSQEKQAPINNPTEGVGSVGAASGALIKNTPHLSGEGVRHGQRTERRFWQMKVVRSLRLLNLACSLSLKRQEAALQSDHCPSNRSWTRIHSAGLAGWSSKTCESITFSALLRRRTRLVRRSVGVSFIALVIVCKRLGIASDYFLSGLFLFAQAKASALVSKDWLSPRREMSPFL